MRITIGIDIGGSTTKIVGIRGGQIITPMLVKANDPVASLFGAFGKFIDANNFKLSEIEQIMLTGVGASFMNKPLYGLPTGKAEEFMANGLGGLRLSGLDRAIIVSMGTGTALVKADSQSIAHLGGTGIGGGTIIGLSNRMLNVRDIQLIIQLAEAGDLSNIDLMVGDLTQDVLPGLPPETTASNFGKTSDIAKKEDVALGIINMVLQSIGMTAIFASRSAGMSDVVLIGNLTTIPQSHNIFLGLQNLFGIRFIIPPNSEYGTAVGAALCYLQKADGSASFDSTSQEGL